CISGGTSSSPAADAGSTPKLTESVEYRSKSASMPLTAGRAAMGTIPLRRCAPTLSTRPPLVNNGTLQHGNNSRGKPVNLPPEARESLWDAAEEAAADYRIERFSGLFTV